MSRLQDLATLAATTGDRPPVPRPLRRLGDLVQAVTLHPIARRLPLTFSAEQLADDLARVEESWWGRHLGPYHDGNWESVALWAPRGDRKEQRSHGGAFRATEVLEQCHYFAQVMDAFPCEKNRVRLMRLRPGGHILRHSDPLHQISAHLIRVHVPVVTSPAVRFLVKDQVIVMRAGEAWHVDVRFPHEVSNEGTSDRIHLVLDLMANREISALLRGAESMGRGFLTGYYLRHSLPERARRYFRVGN